MLLFILASFRVFVPENEVYLQHTVKLSFRGIRQFLTLFVAPHLSGPNMMI